MHDTLTNLTSLYRPSVAEKAAGKPGNQFINQKKKTKKKQETFANIFILSLSA